jgi:hypothetical protein
MARWPKPPTRALADATTAYLRREVEHGADPDDLASLLVRIVDARRPRTRYPFPPRSRALMVSWRACRTASGMP